MLIQDGATGTFAGVDGYNRLKTNSSVRHNYAEISRLKGDAFLFAVGGYRTITTVDTNHGMLYLKNNSEVDFHVDNIRSCNTQVSRWMLYKNITGGTIISTADAGVEGSLNLKSNKTANVDVYSGGEGYTFTGGTMVDHWINEVGHSVENFDGSLVLGNGDSIMIMINPLTTNCIACTRIIGHFE
jgi:uncharacterized protein YhdP